MAARIKRQVRTPFNEWIERLPNQTNGSNEASLSPIHELPEHKYDYSAYNLVPYKSSSRTGSDVEPIKYSRHTALKDTRSANRLIITPLPNRLRKPIGKVSSSKTTEIKDRVNTDDILNAVRTRIRSPALITSHAESNDVKLRQSNADDVDRILEHYLQLAADNQLTLELNKTRNIIIPTSSQEKVIKTRENILAPDHELGLLGSCACCQMINEDNLRKRAYPNQDVLGSYHNNVDSIVLNARDSTMNGAHRLLKHGVSNYASPRRQIALPEYGGLLMHNVDPFAAYYPSHSALENNSALQFKKPTKNHIEESHERYQQALDKLRNYVDDKRDELTDLHLQSLMALPSSELRSEHSIAHHQLYGHWSPPTTPLHPIDFNRPELFRPPLVIPGHRRRPLATPTPFASLQLQGVTQKNKLVTFNRQPPVQIEYTPENSSLNDADVGKRQRNKYMPLKSSISPRDQLPPMS